MAVSLVLTRGIYWWRKVDDVHWKIDRQKKQQYKERNRKGRKWLNVYDLGARRPLQTILSVRTPLWQLALGAESQLLFGSLVALRIITAFVPHSPVTNSSLIFFSSFFACQKFLFTICQNCVVYRLLIMFFFLTWS